MSKPRGDAFDVAIIGYGPTGALLASLLARRGWRVAAFDRAPDVVPHPRAVHFDAEVMRVFQRAGVADALADAIVPVEGMHFLNDEGTLIFHYEAERGVGPLGWHQGYMFHQPGLERALRSANAARPEIETFLGFDVTEIRDDAGGVTVGAQGPDGPIAIAARYAVGCCGARSITRGVVGGGVHDYRFDQTWLVLDILLARDIDLPRTTVQYCEIARPHTYVMTPGRRRRFEFMKMHGDTTEQLLSPSMQQQLLERWLPPADYTIERSAVYDFHGLVADTWRNDRVMIAGDAAHQMPPFLGQGMCAGVRDAANLEWKLDLVLRGAARASLLDTYASERIPNVRLVVEDDIKLGELIQNTTVEGARMRDAIALRGGGPTPLKPKWYPIGDGLCAANAPARLPFPQPVLAGGQRHDALLGSGFAIVGDLDASPATEARLASLAPIRLRQPQPAIASWLREQAATAAIVRPDAIVLGVAATAADMDLLFEPLLRHLDP
jgi:3-(3-hydroxy-phenyl)propionate hydroxylase